LDSQAVPGLSVLGGDVEHPEVTGFQEVLADAQGRHGSSAQRNEGKKRNEQTIAVLKCLEFSDDVFFGRPHP
jgi:hypothetical protein